MRGSIRSLFGIGLSKRQTDPKDETSPDPRLAIIAAAAPDPALVAEDEAGLKKEQREATADKAVARAETPFWMRQVFGDLSVEYRMGAGLLFMVLLSSVVLAAIGGKDTSQILLTQLIDILKAIAAGMAGGVLVRRVNSRND